MQLKKKRGRQLRGRLLASSCALLATAGARAATDDWSFDSGLLYYAESDRVKATEPTFIVKRKLDDESSLSARFVVDSLTGATPTGAMPSSRGASVTGASGTVSSTAGEFPLASFRDLRSAVSATWSRRMGGDWQLDVGGNLSVERDFRSHGANALLARDFNRHNTTLSLGASYEGDSIIPHGGVQLPLGEVGSLDTLIASDAHKTVKGALVGITQVMNQSWIASLNYSYSNSHGYLNDPYKVISVLNTHLGGLVLNFGPPIGGFGPPIGEPVLSLYENRPGTRNERAVYLVNKAYLAGSVAELSYRYGRDDWGIHSNTYELRYRVPFGENFYFQPHLRYYHQTAADFYQRTLLDSDPLPVYVSADYRLANITGRTIGLEFGEDVEAGSVLRVRLERYVQSGRVDPRALVGVQQDYNSFPDLKAYIAQISYSF
jgi:hypothetical protein